MVVLSGIVTTKASGEVIAQRSNMMPVNFERTLRKFSQRKPFRPFVVELTSGTQIHVEHPEALAFYNGIAVYLAGDDYMFFDHHTVARVGGNGKSPRSTSKDRPA
jgi:hypothetical protein